MTRKILSNFLAASAIVFLASACTASEAQTAPNADATVSTPPTSDAEFAYTESVGDSAPLIVDGKRQSGSGQAGMGGIVGVNEMGCITIGSRIAVAPLGSHLDGDVLTVSNYPVSTIGEHVTFGGTTFELPGRNDPDGVLAGCVPEDDPLAVFGRIAVVP